MDRWTTRQWKSLRRARLWAVALALALIASVGSYEIFKPAAASAATMAPAAAPLDDNSVSALLSLDQAVERVASRVTPALVNVTVVSKGKSRVFIHNQDNQNQDGNGLQQFFGPFGFGPFQFPQMRQRPQIEHGLGSGIILSPDGYIATNNHVIEGAVDIRVTTSDRRVLPAKLVGADPLTDLAVLKVNATNLPSVPWGDSSALKPGQTVLAFGNPFGFRFTVTRGIVSALNRSNPYDTDRRKPGEFIQTDAAINPGNSGGPLVNARGEVVGINTFLISPSGSFSGMGFAIPSQIARPIVATLIKDGKVEHARIGVSISDVTPDNASFFHLKSANGAVISQVEPDSAGDKAGLKVGDVVTQLDGKKVEDSGQLQATIVQKRPGTKVELGIIRDGKSKTIPVTLEAMNKLESASNGSSASHGKVRWGLGLMDMTPDIRDQLNLPSSVKGAVVANVQPGSPADNAGITRGDVILEVNRKAVDNSAAAKRDLESVGQGKDALVLVWSRGGSTFRVMHPTEAQQGNGD